MISHTLLILTFRGWVWLLADADLLLWHCIALGYRDKNLRILNEALDTYVAVLFFVFHQNSDSESYQTNVMKGRFFRVQMCRPAGPGQDTQLTATSYAAHEAKGPEQVFSS